MQEPRHHNTAILVFLRDIHEEARVKRWLSRAGHRKNLQAIALLNEKAIRLARGTGLPTHVISGARQKGSTFAERFTRVLGEIFSRGYDRVISIGNDCLHLRADHLDEAIEAMQAHDLVLGPDQRGGAYLLGIHQNLFEDCRFLRLPWQERTLLEGLHDLASEQGRQAFVLPMERDANNASDFKKLLPGLTDRVLQQALRVLAHGAFILPESRYLFHLFPLSFQPVSSRAPPSFYRETPC